MLFVGSTSGAENPIPSSHMPTLPCMKLVWHSFQLNPIDPGGAVSFISFAYSSAAQIADCIDDPSKCISGFSGFPGNADRVANRPGVTGKYDSNSASCSSKSSGSEWYRSRRSARAVAGSVPAARPMPKSTRPGKSPASIENVSATFSGL